MLTALLVTVMSILFTRIVVRCHNGRRHDDNYYGYLGGGGGGSRDPSVLSLVR